MLFLYDFCAENLSVVCQSVNDTVFAQIVKFKIAAIRHLRCFIFAMLSCTIIKVHRFGASDITSEYEMHCFNDLMHVDHLGKMTNKPDKYEVKKWVS